MKNILMRIFELYYVQNIQYKHEHFISKKDIKRFEGVQRRTTELVLSLRYETNHMKQDLEKQSFFNCVTGWRIGKSFIFQRLIYLVSFI